MIILLDKNERLKELAEILTEAFKLSFTEEDVEYRIEDGNRLYGVLDKDNKIEGFMHIRFIKDKEITYINLIDIVSSKVGLGSRLVNFLKIYGLPIKVLALNKDVYPFYEKCGFVKDKGKLSSFTYTPLPTLYPSE